MRYFINLARKSIQLDHFSNNDKKWVYNVLGFLLALFSFGLVACAYQPLFIIYICIYLICLVCAKFLEKAHLFMLLACLLCLGISGLILYKRSIIFLASLSTTLSMFISWLLCNEVREIEKQEYALLENIKSRLQIEIEQSQILEKEKLHTEKEIQKLYTDLAEQTNYITSLKELIHEQQYTINTLLHQKEETLEQCRNLHKESQERQWRISKLESNLKALQAVESNQALIDKLNTLRLEYFQHRLMTDQLIHSNLKLDKICAYVSKFIQVEEELYHKLEDVHDLRLAKIYLETIIAQMDKNYEQLLEENRVLEGIVKQYLQREKFYEMLDHENDFLEKNIQVLLSKKRKKAISIKEIAT